MKNKFKNEHFNNSYLMLLKFKKKLKFIDDTQFMKFTKKYYSLNINNFKKMFELLNKIKKFEKQLIVTKIIFIDDMRTIICFIITLIQNNNYRSFIQIWIVISNFIAEKIKIMFMKKYRQQKHAEKKMLLKNFNQKQQKHSTKKSIAKQKNVKNKNKKNRKM